MSLQVYDNFDRPGYSLADYSEKWTMPYGLGEMGVNDTRDFSGGPPLCIRLAAQDVPELSRSSCSPTGSVF
jgi:hypothetical protein